MEQELSTDPQGLDADFLGKIVYHAKLFEVSHVPPEQVQPSEFSNRLEYCARCDVCRHPDV